MVLPDSRRVPRVPRYLGAIERVLSLSPTGLSPSAAAFPKDVRLKTGFVTHRACCRSPLTVPRHRIRNAGRLYSRTRFRLMRVRSPLLAQSLLFSFPPGTEMFQFSGCPLPALCVQAGVPCIAWRVSPFGYLRVTGCLRLTGASRRLLRPSSAPCPKASTVRPYQLEPHTHCTTPTPISMGAGRQHRHNSQQTTSPQGPNPGTINTHTLKDTRALQN